MFPKDYYTDRIEVSGSITETKTCTQITLKNSVV